VKSETGDVVLCIERSHNKILVTDCLAVMLHLSPIGLSTMRHCAACKLIVRACDVGVSNGREVMSVAVTLRPSQLVIKIKLASGCVASHASLWQPRNASRAGSHPPRASLPLACQEWFPHAGLYWTLPASSFVPRAEPWSPEACTAKKSHSQSWS
jgi:hypothetical protein